MDALIRRGRESDMSALRDIINHYIVNSVVTFEMVEMSLENRRTWFTQFTEDGRYQLFVAEKEGEVAGLLHQGGHKFGEYHDVRIYEHRLDK